MNASSPRHKDGPRPPERRQRPESRRLAARLAPPSLLDRLTTLFGANTDNDNWHTPWAQCLGAPLGRPRRLWPPGSAGRSPNKSAPLLC